MKRYLRSFLFGLYVLVYLLPLHTQARVLKHVKTAWRSNANFGKTHFIVGYTPSQEKALPQEPIVSDAQFNLVCDGRVKQVFFAPDDSVQKVLLHLIEQEKKSIKIAIFTFTDGDISQALLAARNRGVNVELVVDKNFEKDRFSKVKVLQDAGLTVYIYNPEHNKEKKNSLITSIMHNKFVLFEQNILDKALIWTGSFNLTKSAHRLNQENVLVLDEALFVQKYTQQFERLKTRCHAHKKKMTVAKRAKKIHKKSTIV